MNISRFFYMLLHDCMPTLADGIWRGSTGVSSVQADILSKSENV